jgi:diacylglycerol kinase family enzyme
MRVTTPDGTSAEGVMALVFNTRPYAAYFTPAPGARRDDGLFDAVVLRRGGALDIPRWTWKGLCGTLYRDSSATLLRAASFRVESDAALPWQADGDVGGDTPLDIVVRPAALRVIVPPDKEMHTS